MATDSAILFTKWLRHDRRAAVWPAGATIAAFDEARHPKSCHLLLERSYAQGQGEVPAFADWWHGVRSDSEYAVSCMFVATDDSARPIAFAHCWISAFLKDFAVSPEWRRRGLGTALLAHVFGVFRNDGFDTLTLKVRPANPAAIAFYEAIGMVRES